MVKNVISGSKSFTKRSIDNIEVKKVKWELKRHKQELGDYIYKSNTEDNTFNFSGDESFDRINDINYAYLGIIYYLITNKMDFKDLFN